MSLLSFLNATKNPPSLLYLSMTVGPALVVLSLLENVQNKFASILIVYGNVPLFYYILHIYLIHLLSAIAFFMRGHSLEEASKTGNVFPFYFLAPGEGYGLTIVYAVWLFVVMLLYPLCKWYDKYKSSHKEKWWLSYL